MGIEIERKFLVDKRLWEQVEKPTGDYLKQGYLYSDASKTIRVRATNECGFITIKGASTSNGLSRSEYEYKIPKQDALQLLDELASSFIEKIRYTISINGLRWEVDVFGGSNKGLIVAELELSNEQQSFQPPEWILKEVTGDDRYYNARLAIHPFSAW